MGFLIAYQYSGFRFATIVMIVAVAVAFIVLRALEGHTPYFALLNTLSVIIFGGVSVFVDIPSIFICRDTLFDVLLGGILFFSLRTKEPGLKILFGKVFAITEKGWRIFTARWAFFFLLLAAINEFVRQTFDANTWVAAKVGMIVITFIFGMYQLTLTRRERLPEADALGLIR